MPRFASLTEELFRRQYFRSISTEEEALYWQDAWDECRGSTRRPPPPRRRRESPLKARAAGQGLKRWQVSYGLPRRVSDLARLEAWFEELGALSATAQAPNGRWPLSIENKDFVVPARLTLDLLDAAGGRTEFLLSAIVQYHDGASVGTALKLAGRIRTRLAQRRVADVMAWAKRYGLWLHAWEPSALLCLGRQPEDLRWALLHERTVSEDSGADLRKLNWAAFRLAKGSTPAKLAYLPPQALWERMLGHPAPSRLTLPDLRGFKFGVLRRLAREFGVSVESPDKSPVRGWLPAFVTLVRLFGDYESIQRFVRSSHPWSLLGLHDAGQFQLPEANARWTPSRWSALCLRHPAAAAMAQHFARLEESGAAPRSLNELQRMVGRLSYPAIPARWEALAEACLDARLSAHDFQTYRDFWLKTKTKPADCMPSVQLEGATLGLPGWRLLKLSPSDYRGPMLGLLTGCCQHLRGAGSPCAEHGVTSPYSAFYVIERNGKVVAQSWVWRNMRGGLVFDSVEALDRSNEVVAATAKLLLAAKDQFLNKSLGVSSVFISEASCGITSEVASALGASTKVYATVPADGCTYSDGRWHRLWAGQPQTRNQPLPKIEGYQQTKAERVPQHTRIQEQLVFEQLREEMYINATAWEDERFERLAWGHTPERGLWLIR